MPDLKAAIAVELYEAVRRLGAKSDLLGIIGSYGDALKDEDVLEMLQQYNSQRAEEPPANEIDY